MARARNIKPGFWTNEHIVELDPWARLLYIGLWMIADRDGRLEDRPKRIKMEIFPADTVDADALLSEIESHGLIRRYSVNGANLIWIPGFVDHQNPHRNEKCSDLPPHPEDVIGTLRDDSRNVASDRAESLNTESRYLKPDSGDGEPAPAGASIGADAPPTTTDDPPIPDDPPVEATKRGYRLRDDFTPSAGLIAWAQNELGMKAEEITYETEKFCDHFRGSGATKKDWPATWRNWMRTAVEGRYSRGRASPGQSRAAPPGALTRDELLARARGEVPV